MDRRLRIDPGLIVGLPKQFGCVPDNQDPSWQTHMHYCLSNRRDPRIMDHCRRCEPTEKWSITHSWGALLTRLVYLAEANLGHPIANWGRCEGARTRFILILMPVAAALQQQGQGAEALEPISLVDSGVAIGAESTIKTTRAGRDHYLTYICQDYLPRSDGRDGVSAISFEGCVAVGTFLAPQGYWAARGRGG